MSAPNTARDVSEAPRVAAKPGLSKSTHPEWGLFKGLLAHPPALHAHAPISATYPLTLSLQAITAQ